MEQTTMSHDDIHRVFCAGFATIDRVGGPVPDEPAELAAYLKKWCSLIRRCDPRLAQFSDNAIIKALGSE
jgi:hypothetical protein